MRFLTPTGNKRLNELIGFLCLTLAILLAAALFTYWPADPSFSVSASSANEAPPHNLIGPVGAYSADLMFQALGYSAFLLPLAVFWLGLKWFRSKQVESQKAMLFGYGLLLLSRAMLQVPNSQTAAPFYYEVASLRADANAEAVYRGVPEGQRDFGIVTY